MKKLFLVLAVAVGGTGLAVQPVPICQSGFEPTEGYEAAANLGKSGSWQGEGTISAEDAASGEQSLAVTGEVTLRYPEWTAGKLVAYADFEIRAVADDSEEPYSTIQADGARLAFLKEAEGGVLYAGDGENAGVAVSTARELDEEGRATEWMRITLRLDYEAATYDVYVDGAPAAVNLRFDPEDKSSAPKSFTIRGEAGEIRLDDFKLTAANPLYEDRDDDGLPDAYEEANGTNPNRNDRLGDIDANGTVNIAEFQQEALQAGEALSSSSEMGAGVIYVDNQNGSDQCAGRMCYRLGGEGPKASLEAAVEAASSEDVIILMPSAYPYSVSAISNAKKNIKLRPIGRVTLQ